MTACVADADVVRMLDKAKLAYFRTETEQFNTIETRDGLNVFVVIMNKNGCVERSLLLPKVLRDQMLGEPT